MTGKEVARNIFGEQRTIASQVAHANPGLDEEAYFVELVGAFVSGFKSEVGKIFTVERTADMLDPFK